MKTRAISWERDAVRSTTAHWTRGLYGINSGCGKRQNDRMLPLDKPVIAINTATLWHAYRVNGFLDNVYGFGSLLSEH